MTGAKRAVQAVAMIGSRVMAATIGRIDRKGRGAAQNFPGLESRAVRPSSLAATEDAMRSLIIGASGGIGGALCHEARRRRMGA